MAAPVVAASTTFLENTGAADPTFSLAALGTINAGDLLIVGLCSTASMGLPATVPSGWTGLVNPSSGGGTRSGDREVIHYKFAAGGESSVQVFTGNASAVVKYMGFALKITGADPANPPQASAITFGTSTLPDAPSLTPSGGAKDYLFLAYAEQEGASTAGTIPSGYTQIFDIATTGGGTATNGRMVLARKATTAATSDDPAAWGAWSISEDWAAITMAVPPAPAAAPTSFVSWIAEE